MLHNRFCFALLLVLLVSCQQEVTDIVPAPVEPIPDSTAPAPNGLIRKIDLTGSFFSEPLNLTYSIQYDTLGAKIVVLVKDSTGNLISPDVTGIAYGFNNAGYLMKGEILLTGGGTTPEFSISRKANNQIEKIIEYDAEEINGVSYNDTNYYRYGSGFIEDSVRIVSFGNPPSSYFARKVRTFDVQNRIQSFKYYGNNELFNEFTYTYDALNNIKRIATLRDTIDFTYGISTDTAWKRLPELFLGRDAHVLLKERYDDFGYGFLTSVIESQFESIYNPMFIQPLTRMVRYGSPAIEPDATKQVIVSFATTYTSDGKIRSITKTPSDDTGPITYTFHY